MSKFNALKFIADNHSMSLTDAITKAYNLGIENANNEKECIIRELREAGRIIIDDDGNGYDVILKRKAIEIVERGLSDE